MLAQCWLNAGPIPKSRDLHLASIWPVLMYLTLVLLRSCIYRLKQILNQIICH